MEGEPVHPTRQRVEPRPPANNKQNTTNINTAGGGRIRQQRINRGKKQITVQGT